MLKVLEIAEAEVGYLEKASNANLDSKTANAGSANYTKYARDLDNIPGFYNGKKNGYAWCDMFVDWCFVQAYGVAMAKKLLGQPEKSYGASCAASVNYYKAMGRYFKDPKVGDQIFFWYDGAPNHTGLVYKVDDNYVYTIEGNTSGASGVIPNGGGVCKKAYYRAYDKICGYGRPDYSLVAESATSGNTEAEEGDCMVSLFMLSKGNKGSQVKTLQATLITKWGISCGSYGADGDFGDATKNAVLAFQRRRGLEVDGIVGQQTWSALLK